MASNSQDSSEMGVISFSIGALFSILKYLSLCSVGYVIIYYQVSHTRSRPSICCGWVGGNYTKGDMRLELHHTVKVSGLLAVSALHISLSCRINCMFGKLRTWADSPPPRLIWTLQIAYPVA
jgi:hypothetical protein